MTNNRIIVVQGLEISEQLLFMEKVLITAAAI